MFAFSSARVSLEDSDPEIRSSGATREVIVSSDILSGAAHGLRFWATPLAMMGVGSYDGFLIATNAAYTDALGWTEDELRAVPYWELLHPEDQHAMVEDGDRLMSTGGTRFGYDVRVLCRNGTFKWTRWSTVADEDANLLYGLGIDISDLKPLIADAPLAIGTWLRHIPTRTLKWSDELHAMFDLPAGEPLDDERILERIHPDDRLTLIVEWPAAMAEAGYFAGTFRVNRVDGRVRVLYSSGRVTEFDSAESPVSIRGLTIDVTDQRTP
ncbi:MAG TPA: PAS domain-containing protein [Mycobacteriales bacterium]|nr:PAS domain-containing protein [Mycobacteriales bacterium]